MKSGVERTICSKIKQIWFARNCVQKDADRNGLH